jgi:hypothetical protein
MGTRICTCLDSACVCTYASGLSDGGESDGGASYGGEVSGGEDEGEDKW